MQCFYRAGFRTFVAENALRSIFPLAGLLIDLHIHGTNPQAFAAMDTLAFITVNPKQRQSIMQWKRFSVRCFLDVVGVSTTVGRLWYWIFFLTGSRRSREKRSWVFCDM